MYWHLNIRLSICLSMYHMDHKQNLMQITIAKIISIINVNITVNLIVNVIIDSLLF